jgi:ribosome-binding factor A
MLDTLPEGAQHMEDLVARARAADAELASVREGAEPAGDPDPYREHAPPVSGEDAGQPSDLLGGTPASGDHRAGYSPT